MSIYPDDKILTLIAVLRSEESAGNPHDSEVAAWQRRGHLSFAKAGPRKQTAHPPRGPGSTSSYWSWTRALSGRRVPKSDMVKQAEKNRRRPGRPTRPAVNLSDGLTVDLSSEVYPGKKVGPTSSPTPILGKEYSASTHTCTVIPTQPCGRRRSSSVLAVSPLRY